MSEVLIFLTIVALMVLFSWVMWGFFNLTLGSDDTIVIGPSKPKQEEKEAPTIIKANKLPKHLEEKMDKLCPPTGLTSHEQFEMVELDELQQILRDKYGEGDSGE